MLDELRLLHANLLHGGKKVLDLLIVLGGSLSLPSDISDKDLKLASPLSMVVLELGLPLGSLLLKNRELMRELLNGIVIVLTLDVIVVALKILKILQLGGDLILLSLKVLSELLTLLVSIPSNLSLLLNLPL